MHTRLLMGFSAACMAVAGLVLSFLPAETLSAAGIEPNRIAVISAQVAGALYLGFAVLNWSSRGILIGGIYARPVALGNFMHFAVAAATLVKAATVAATPVLVTFAVLYAVLAAWFALVLFRSPVSTASPEGRQ